MKRRTLLDLWNTIMKLEEFKSNIKFSYFIARNKMLLKKEIELLMEVQKPSDDFLAFDNKRVLLLQKYADKDKNGKTQFCTQSNQYFLTTNREQFEEEFSKLREEYKDVLDIRDKQMKTFSEMVEEDIQVQLMKIKLSHLPTEIEPVVLNVFMEADLVEDDSEMGNDKEG